jgi:peroxiredoxin Q/BCP
MATKKKVTKKKTAKKTTKKAPAKKPAKKSAVKKAGAKKTVTKKTVAKKTTKKATRKPVSKPAKDTLLKPGQVAPYFSLFSDEETTVSLSHFPGKKIVLYFYPKDDTPGCTQESCDFRDSFTRLLGRGAVVLGVSKDSVRSHRKFKEKYSLPFPLLSDESGKMLSAYGVWKEKSLYGKKFMGIERTTYLIDVDMDGKAVIRKSYPKVKVQGHVDEILQDLG